MKQKGIKFSIQHLKKYFLIEAQKKLSMLLQTSKISPEIKIIRKGRKRLLLP